MHLASPVGIVLSSKMWLCVHVCGGREKNLRGEVVRLLPWVMEVTADKCETLTGLSARG